jgi:thioesterase domain-containing protein
MVSGWRRWVSDVEAWHGPGDHFSVLRAPHANALAQWWRRAIEGP